jgi:hypothetical protein
MGGDRRVYKILMGKPKGKRPLGRQRRRCEDRIRMDLRKLAGRGCVEWIQVLRIWAGGGLVSIR